MPGRKPQENLLSFGRRVDHPPDMGRRIKVAAIEMFGQLSVGRTPGHFGLVQERNHAGESNLGVIPIADLRKRAS